MTPQDSQTLASVIELLRAREAAGVAKYGKTLDQQGATYDGKDWAMHALEEALDCCLYLTKRVRELEAERPRRRSPFRKGYVMVWNGASPTEDAIRNQKGHAMKLVQGLRDSQRALIGIRRVVTEMEVSASGLPDEDGTVRAAAWAEIALRLKHLYDDIHRATTNPDLMAAAYNDRMMGSR